MAAQVLLNGMERSLCFCAMAFQGTLAYGRGSLTSSCGSKAATIGGAGDDPSIGPPKAVWPPSAAAATMSVACPGRGPAPGPPKAS